jgi:hypothetical protein
VDEGVGAVLDLSWTVATMHFGTGDDGLEHGEWRRAFSYDRWPSVTPRPGRKRRRSTHSLRRHRFQYCH